MNKYEFKELLQEMLKKHLSIAIYGNEVFVYFDDEVIAYDSIL